MNEPRKIRVYLLPGLDGTGRLLDAFVEKCPPGFEAVPIAYPPNRILSYEELADVISNKIEVDAPMILLGESFGGPLSLRLASLNPRNLIGVVLVATFVRPPALSLARFLPWRIGFRMRAPVYAIRAALAGKTASGALLQSAREVLQHVSPDVLAARVRSVLAVDARDWLKNCPAPILYLAGKQDTLVKPRCFETIKMIRPDVMHREISAPHFVLQIAPSEAWRAIEDFVAEGRVV